MLLYLENNTFHANDENVQCKEPSGILFSEAKVTHAAIRGPTDLHVDHGVDALVRIGVRGRDSQSASQAAPYIHWLNSPKSKHHLNLIRSLPNRISMNQNATKGWENVECPKAGQQART